MVESIRIHMHLSKKEAAVRAESLLARVGMPDPHAIMKKYPHTLSGGMRQRVMIAMALACNPRLLIADEPTTALDVTIQAQIMNLLKELQQETGMAMILITHDIGVVANMADRVLVMYAGQIVESGDVREIFYNPCHPYTQDLIGSIPKTGNSGSELVTIPGAPPQLNKDIVGCPYAPRCKKACDKCHKEAPSLRQAKDGHDYLCFLDPDGNMQQEV